MSEQRLIDANALIAKYGSWYTEEGTEEGYIGTIKGIVDCMPTIEPKQGHWVGIDDEPYDDWECDRCGEIVTDCGWDVLPNFCPNCGADMRGEEDG